MHIPVGAGATFILILRVRKAIAATALVMTAVAFFSSPMFGAVKLAFAYYDPFSIAEFRLRHLATQEYVKKIEEAIVERDYQDAAKIVEIGQENGHNFDPELIAKTRENAIDMSWRYSVDLVDGFMSGSVHSPGSLAGSMVADAVSYGDIRDAYNEGSEILSGQDYDGVTLGLSLFGIVTSVAAQAEIDVPLSVLKTANKTRKLSAGIRASLVRISQNMIDVPMLKRALSNSADPLLKAPSFTAVKRVLSSISYKDVKELDFAGLKASVGDLLPIDVAAAKRRFKGVVRPDAANDLAAFTAGTSTVVFNGGPEAAFRSLEKADSPKELAKFGKLAEKARDRTSSIIRILGRGAIDLGRLAYLIGASAIYAITWFLGAIWTISTFLFNLRALFR
ncbi:transcriptional regulator [Mesorhizobium sp. BR-1-1-8]|uniref:transcriptional regulator n=1 Tax=Mesorhizobium sp. BR-1-1-8 TaxID=2876659 RepID=UPI001CCBC699|nr:transcriptional regulator [Mesorhizobium sp. BR-1-1-8]MBZ9983988.1 transcriptional regulator [Mesorhizobium sp. BR-1-1-8]